MAIIYSDFLISSTCPTSAAYKEGLLMGTQPFKIGTRVYFSHFYLSQFIGRIMKIICRYKQLARQENMH